MAGNQLVEQLAQFLPRQTAELVAGCALMAGQLIAAAADKQALEARVAELEKAAQEDAP